MAVTVKITLANRDADYITDFVILEDSKEKSDEAAGIGVGRLKKAKHPSRHGHTVFEVEHTLVTSFGNYRVVPTFRTESEDKDIVFKGKKKQVAGRWEPGKDHIGWFDIKPRHELNFVPRPNEGLVSCH